MKNRKKEMELVHPRMQRFLLRYGILRSSLIITAGAVLFAILVASLLILLYKDFGVDTDPKLMLTIASLATLFLAFPVSLFAIDMYLRLHHMATELQYLATYDTLTGLMGRRVFMEEAARLLERSTQQGETMALLLCDLDNFKRINDRYGHAAGDQVLRAFADTLRNTLPSEAFAGRLGGEEFCIALPHTDKLKTFAFSHKLHESIHRTRIHFQDQTILFTFSAGLILLPPGQYDNLDEPLHQADIALYAAKKNGKDQTFLFDDASTLTKV